VNELLDTKLIPEYARVIAAATKTETKPLADAARQSFDAFWKYRTDAPDKAAEFLRAFTADPTVAAPAIPVKVETTQDLNAPAAPTAAGTNVKLAAGAPAGTPGAKPAATNGNGKAATTKTAAKKGGKRRR